MIAKKCKMDLGFVLTEKKWDFFGQYIMADF